jgi:RNA polymerase sigma-70 factor (ECF subfamily)
MEATEVDCADKRTIERLYGAMARAAIAKAYAIVRRQDVAAEIAHDAFIKLWQSGGRFPSDKAVYAWIYKTCHNAAIDHVRSAPYRRETSATPAGDEDGADVNANVTVDVYARHAAPDGAGPDALMNRELVETYIRTLRPQEAEAFVYQAVDGMTQVEIAAVMGLSRRTVQRLMERVEARLSEIRRRDAL